MRNRSIASLALGLALATTMPRGEARADFVVNLDTLVNGTQSGGTSPYVTATFHSSATDTVTVTISAPGIAAGEYVDEFLFNVAPSITPSSLSFSSTGPAATFAATTDDAQDGGSQVKGGAFDILVSYANNTMTNSSSPSVITITGTGITAESFKFESTPVTQGSNTYGPYYAAADIKGIAGSKSGSVGATGTVPVPEPSSIALVGLGLAGMTALARRRRAG